MNFAKVHSGSVVAFPYSFLNMRSDHPDTIFNADDNLEQAIEHGRFPVVEEPPEVDPRHQYVTQKAVGQWEIVGEEVRVAYTVHDRTLQERRDMLIPRIEQKRWDVENGGMMFNGAPIPSNDRSKTLINGAYNSALRHGENFSKRWKIEPGVWVPLDAATAIALGDALDAHVSACFDREEVLIQAVIDASTHAAMDDAEAAIDTGWPA